MACAWGRSCPWDRARVLWGVWLLAGNVARAASSWLEWNAVQCPFNGSDHMWREDWGVSRVHELTSSKATCSSEKVPLAGILGLVEFGVDFSWGPPTGLGYDSDRDSPGLVIGLTIGLGPSE